MEDVGLGAAASFLRCELLPLAPQVVASNPKPWPLCTAAEFARRRYTPSL